MHTRLDRIRTWYINCKLGLEHDPETPSPPCTCHEWGRERQMPFPCRHSIGSPHPDEQHERHQKHHRHRPASESVVLLADPDGLVFAQADHANLGPENGAEEPGVLGVGQAAAGRVGWWCVWGGEDKVHCVRLQVCKACH